MIRLQDKDNVVAPDSDYPYGAIKDKDLTPGTPVNVEVYGDMHQFFERLMDKAKVVANGLPDNDYSGFQLFEAFEKFIKAFIYPFHGVYTKRNSSGDFGDAGIGFATRIFPYENYIYVVEGSEDVVTVYNRFTGVEQFNFGTGVLNNPVDVFVVNDKAYVTDFDNGEVHVFDALDGTHLSSEDFGSGVLSGPLGIAIANGRAYVTNGSTASVSVFDVVSKTHLSSDDFGVAANDIAITKEGKAYIAVDNVIRVYDVSSKAYLSSQNITLSSLEVSYIFAFGTRLFVAQTNVVRRVAVYELSSGTPVLLPNQQIDGLPFATQTSDLCVKDDSLYVLHGNIVHEYKAYLPVDQIIP